MDTLCVVDMLQEKGQKVHVEDLDQNAFDFKLEGWIWKDLGCELREGLLEGAVIAFYVGKNVLEIENFLLSQDRDDLLEELLDQVTKIVFI